MITVKSNKADLRHYMELYCEKAKLIANKTEKMDDNFL